MSAERNVPHRIFIDTLFVIALINRRDQYHQQALDLAGQFEGHPLLVTDAVLLEIGNALARSYKQEAVEIIEQFLAAEEVEVVHLPPRLFARLYLVQEEMALNIECLGSTTLKRPDLLKGFEPDLCFYIQHADAIRDNEEIDLTVDPTT
jgi:hypothetical protein